MNACDMLSAHPQTIGDGIVEEVEPTEIQAGLFRHHATVVTRTTVLSKTSR